MMHGHTYIKRIWKLVKDGLKDLNRAGAQGRMVFVVLLVNLSAS